jgi:uncharacterized protein
MSCNCFPDSDTNKEKANAMMKLQKTLQSVVLICIALSTLSPVNLTAGETSKSIRKVLIVTGVEYHNWRSTTPVIKELVDKDSRLSVDVFEDIMKLSSLDLKPYDAVIMHFQSNKEGVPGRAALDNLKKYVENGGGLVMVHFACGAFQEFRNDFEQLAGRVWMGQKNIPTGRHQHDPRGKFTVNITAVDHPITRNMEDFETVDELYTCLIGDTPIEVLATAVSVRDGKTYPIAFVLNCGKGRVFHCALGHDPLAFEAKDVAEMYRRGCVWAAGRE